MKNIIKYNSDLNKLNMGGLSKVSENLFFVIVHFLLKQGTNTIKIPFSELRSLAHYRPAPGHNFRDDLKKMLKQISALNAEIIEITPKENISHIFPLFDQFDVPEKTEVLTVSVKKEYVFLFNEFKIYTKFDLDEFVSYKHIYTKNLFRSLCQWRRKGELKIIGTDHLRVFCEQIGVKPSYTVNDMIRYCLSKAVNEINECSHSICNLKMSPVYSRRKGNPLEAIIFTWGNKAVKTKTRSRKSTADDAPAFSGGVNEDDSIYNAVKAALKDCEKFSDKDIAAITKAAIKSNITDEQTIERIRYALNQPGVENLVAYISALFKDFNKPVTSSAKDKPSQFAAFPQRSYDATDYDELERRKLGV